MKPIVSRVLALQVPLDGVPGGVPGVASANATNAVLAENAPDQSAPAVMRALVVDDVLMHRDVASHMLRRNGYEVSCAKDGAEAVEAVASMDFDVVLMDVRMPGMDGLEATRRIRQLGGRRGLVPIVALTALDFTEQIFRCLNAGMDGHVAKPYQLDRLCIAVTKAVQDGADS